MDRGAGGNANQQPNLNLNDVARGEIDEGEGTHRCEHPSHAQDSDGLEQPPGRRHVEDAPVQGKQRELAERKGRGMDDGKVIEPFGELNGVIRVLMIRILPVMIVLHLSDTESAVSPGEYLALM